MTASSFESPEAAEDAFYQAFASGDLALMENVWADADSVICVHPGGDKLVGYQAVIEGWRDILGSDAPLRFQLTEKQVQGGADFAVHTLYENIRFVDGSGDGGRVLATNVYMREDTGWRMVLHHASPLPSVSRNGALH